MEQERLLIETLLNSQKTNNQKIKSIDIKWDWVEGESHESLKPFIKIEFYE